MGTVRRFVRRACVIPNSYLLVLSFLAIMHILHLVFFVTTLINEDDVKSVVKIAYAAFVVLGLLHYFLIASPFIYLPYAHGSEMSPDSRLDYLCLGVGLDGAMHAFPLGWLQMWLVTDHGITSTLQAITLIMSSLTFVGALGTTWLAYAWKMSFWLQERYTPAFPAAQQRAQVPRLGDGFTHQI